MPALTNYTGNAGLGSGSNPQIPVSDTGKGLDPLNQAARDSMILNVENQRQLYQQKIKDHEEMLKLIASAELKVGDMLDRDRETVRKSLEGLDEAWRERGKRGFNDIDAAVKYNKAKREAEQNIHQAQARFVVDKQVQDDAAKEEDPAVRDEMLKGHDQYLGGFWNDYKPYVRAQVFDHPKMLETQLTDALVPNEGIGADIAGEHRFTTKTTIGKDGKPSVTTWDTVRNKPATAAQQKAMATQGTGGGLSMFDTVPGKYYDFNKILTNTADMQHDFKQRKNEQIYLDFLQNKASPVQANSIIDHANQRIDDYNREREFAADDPNRVTKLKVGYDDNGQRFFTDETGKALLPFETNARLALANISGDYVEKDKRQFNKAIADYLLDKDRLALDKSKLGLDWSKFNYAKEEDKYGASSVINEAKDIINKGAPTTIKRPDGTSEDVLTIGDPTLLKTFGTIDKDGTISNIPDAVYYDKNNDQVRLIYYQKTPIKREKDAAGTVTTTGGDIVPVPGGGKLVSRQVSMDQRTWLKEIAKRSFPNKDIGKINELVDGALNQGGNSLYKMGEGQRKADYYKNPDNFVSMDGNRVTYKDGSVWEIVGNQMKQIK